MDDVNTEQEVDPRRFIPIPLSTIRVNSVTKFALYLHSEEDSRFVLYAQRGLEFTVEAQKGLEESRVEALYIDSTQRSQYRDYLSDHLSDILEDPEVPIKSKAEVLYATSETLVQEIFSNPESTESRKRGRQIAARTVDILAQERTALEHLMATVPIDYKVYTHCVNVCVYGVALSLRAGIPDDARLRDFANGAILIDIGKSQIHPDILDHDGELSLEQWEAVKQHPTLGLNILEKGGGAGKIALEIVGNHHELLNGSGYPRGLSGNDISQGVRIATIADVFDALTTNRPFQRAVSTYEALRVMNEEMADALDTKLFRLFVEMMGKPRE